MKITVVAKTELKGEYICDDNDVTKHVNEAIDDIKEKAEELDIKIENWDIKVKPD